MFIASFTEFGILESSQEKEEAEEKERAEKEKKEQEEREEKEKEEMRAKEEQREAERTLSMRTHTGRKKSSGAGKTKKRSRAIMFQQIDFILKLSEGFPRLRKLSSW